MAPHAANQEMASHQVQLSGRQIRARADFAVGRISAAAVSAALRLQRLTRR
jgi:hypothetical protein